MQSVSDAVLKHEEQALQANTAKDTRGIIRYAEEEIKMAAQRERRELKAFAADLAVSVARQSIRVDKTTDQRLIRALVKGLEQSGELSQTTTEASAKAIAYAVASVSLETLIRSWNGGRRVTAIRKHQVIVPRRDSQPGATIYGRLHEKGWLQRWDAAHSFSCHQSTRGIDRSRELRA
jgi:hypothetical protein